MNNNLRKINVIKKQLDIDSNEEKGDMFKAYFHKWFETKNPISGTNEQYAIIENEEGFVSKISINDYQIKFRNINDAIDEVYNNIEEKEQ